MQWLVVAVCSRGMAGQLTAAMLDEKLDANGTSFEEASTAAGYGGASHEVQRCLQLCLRILYIPYSLTGQSQAIMHQARTAGLGFLNCTDRNFSESRRSKDDQSTRCEAVRCSPDQQCYACLRLPCCLSDADQLPVIRRFWRGRG